MVIPLIKHIPNLKKTQAALCVCFCERVLFSLHPHHMSLVLNCYYAVRAVYGLWVQLGDGRPDGDVKCATERAQLIPRTPRVI